MKAHICEEGRRMKIRFGSVCSGIEAASVAWNPLGWEAAWFSEIEPFPCAVLAHHFPNVPNLGDMTTLPGRIRKGEIEAPDILCGGTPCQAFSVAGQRKSLDDERGNLSLTFCEIANALDTVRTLRGDPPTTSSGKTSPESSTQKITPSGASLANFAEAGFRFVRQNATETTSGQVRVMLRDRNVRSRGASLTLNTSESPNAVVESSLSQVLERTSIPSKYFLSVRACQGILRRAEARGKELPSELKKALLQAVKA